MITALITAAVTSENNSLDYFVWVIFSLFVIVALALDLGLLNQVVYIFKNKYKNGRPSNKDVDRYKNIEFDSDFGSLSNHTSNPNPFLMQKTLILPLLQLKSRKHLCLDMP